MRRLSLLLLALWLPAAAFAAPVPKAAARQAELAELQGRIESLRAELARGEESKADAADQLRETESAISKANRRLREFATSRAELQSELAQLDAQSRRLGQQVEGQQAQLSRLLYRHFTHGEGDALQLLLAGRDPNQIARDRYFLERLSQAKAGLISGLREAAVEKKRLADAVQEKHGQLAEVEKREKEGRGALVAKQKQRQAMLSKIAGKIKAQKREIGVLQRDEQRLVRLIEGLSRIVSKRKPAPGGRTAPAPRPGRSAGIDPSGAGGAFAALRGALRLPVAGSVAHRFGSKRADTGATWKGLFIRAAEGAEVRSVARGLVVFSDWLRGFGNLLILDHGEGFLSVYGNNQSLLREAGEQVGEGETVATAGNSGGNPESGLYFELRYQGQAFDPMKWVKSR